jgi:membrane protein DedA with SNARE-associated domain
MKLSETIERLFEHFGYLVLLIGLPLDAIALPIPPGNTTLAYTGYLVYRGILDWLPASIAALAGAAMGVTITYWIGYKLGMPLTERFGKWLFMKPVHLEKTRAYYEKYGNKLLIVSFFIPGIRQFIGYFLGIIRVPYRTFALYALTGAGLWVSAFIVVGYAFGERWEYVLLLAERYLKYIFIGLGFVLTAMIYVKWRGRTASK